MLKAQNNRWLGVPISILVRLALRRRFHSVSVKGAGNLSKLDPKQSLIACANHTNWWDGFVAGVFTSKLLGRQIYLGQEEKHLSRYQFFRSLGAFGINLENPGAALPSLRYALLLLTDPKNVVWMFPQGRLHAPDFPIVVKGGVSFLAKKSGATILPCVFRYEFRAEENPAVIISVGEPLPSDCSSERLTSALSLLQRESKSFSNPDEPLPSMFLIKPNLSTNEKWDNLVRIKKTLLVRRQ
ncbi:MAG: lysophospholipid acyltransferase family protein [Verrucomicrobia bacterium]|nr:lysophospholipid acyltransferase family protein [Verrucomicrobiota bacterium]MBV9673980.1 lysophospholipid acyltransferase family protein [Verrucomicrobiota bacterium]